MGVHDRDWYRENPKKAAQSNERYGIFYEKFSGQLTINFRWYHIIAILLILSLPFFSYRFYFGQTPQPVNTPVPFSATPARPEVPLQSPSLPVQVPRKSSRVVSSSLFSVTIPYYEKGYRNVKFLSLEVNSFPVEFLLDTGASYVALTSETIRRLGIRDFSRSSQAMTANGPVNSYLFTIPSMKAGHLEVADVDCVYMPTLRENLLGGSFLSHFQFTINERDSTVTFAVKEGDGAHYPQ
ncbi:MAG: retropepsin-like aspartic protease [Thermodesulfovibrionales bacterium]|jgi:clan AA aspartic protease (TIGR02281 family)